METTERTMKEILDVEDKCDKVRCTMGHTRV